MHNGLMSLESAKAFLLDVNSGRTVLDMEKLTTADPASRLAYVHSFGYDFTKDELSEAAVAAGYPITMEEAESVVGGYSDGPGCPSNAGAAAAGAASGDASGLAVAAIVFVPMAMGG